MANGMYTNKCLVCGELYQLTNWQRRLARDKDGRVHETTVHEAKCKGLTLMPAKESLAHRVANPARYDMKSFLRNMENS